MHYEPYVKPPGLILTRLHLLDSRVGPKFLRASGFRWQLFPKKHPQSCVHVLEREPELCGVHIGAKLSK